MSNSTPNCFVIPHSIVDVYIEVISSHAFKALIFIIRHTTGYQRASESITSMQLANALNIKKISSVRQYILELESLNLIKVIKNVGKTHEYSLGDEFETPPRYGSTPENGSTQIREEYPNSAGVQVQSLPIEATNIEATKLEATSQRSNSQSKEKVPKRKTGLDLQHFLDLGYQQETLEDLIEHRALVVKSPLKTKRMMQGLLNAIKRYSEHWDISAVEALDFYLSQTWKSIDPEYKYPARLLKPQKKTDSLSYSDLREVLRQEQQQSTKGSPVDISRLTSKMRTR